MAKKGTATKVTPRASAKPQPASDGGLLQRAETFIPAILIAIGIVAYHNIFSAPFIFDDRYHIVENTRIRQLWPLSQILGHTSRPMINLSLALNYAFGGLNPWGYHALNVLIHILAAMVLYGIVRRTFLSDPLRTKWGSSASWLAGLIAALWLAHPIQTESVTYTIQRGESLMGLFYLLTLYCVIRGWNVAAVASCLCGMATKGGVMLTAPLLVLLYERVFVFQSWSDVLHRRWRLYAALAATWVSYPFMLASASAEWKESAGFGYTGASPIYYALTQPGVILYYLRLTLWPDALCLDRGWPLVRNAAEVWSQLLTFGALLAATIWAWRKNPPLGFLGAWFFLILAPTSSLIPIADVAVEHRMYLPLAAVVTLAVVALGTRTVVLVAGGLLAVVLAGLTIHRNADYSSALAIWQDTVNKSPSNPRAQYDLGVTLESAGNLDAAIEHYQLAVQLGPIYADALNNLGNILSMSGRPAEAIPYLRRALALKPDLAKAHNSLGHALVQLGQMPEAIGEWKKAMEIQPDYAEPYNNLGIALAQQGNIQEAIAQWEKAIQRDPNLANAHNNLAYTYSQQGQMREAIAHYEQALRINPHYWQAEINFARLLATVAPAQGGDPARAIALAQDACSATGNRNLGCLDTLATAYAAANRFDDAVRTGQDALQLARSSGDLNMARVIEVRLQQYRDKHLNQAR